MDDPVERRNRRGGRGRGRAGHRRGRAHRFPRDPRAPGRDAAPEGPRRHPRRSRPTRPTRPTGGVRDRADRARGGQPLPVRRRPGHRADRHRRAGDGAGARPRTTPTSPSWSIRRTTTRWSPRSRPGGVDRASTRRAPGPTGVRHDRRLRPRHRRLARRHVGRADDDADLPDTLRLTLRAGAAAALRREPAPAGGAVSLRRGPRLVGRGRPARRQGDELPQRVRHRGGVAPRPPVRVDRRASSSSTPTRAAWPSTPATSTWPRPTRAPTRATR